MQVCLWPTRCGKPGPLFGLRYEMIGRLAPKRTHLVRYDYGQGCLWAFVYAESPMQIVERYPELEVVPETPAWFSGDIRSL